MSDDAGLTVWDDQGRVVFDTTSQVVKYFGTVTIGGSAGASGTVVDARFSLGTPYIYAFIENVNITNNWAPTISVSGTTLSWSFPDSGHAYSTVVMYGVF